MAAAKFSLKAQGLITFVYGALTSAWEGETSEQGKKTSSVSEEEVHPKATRQASTAPTPQTAGTGAPHS